MPRGPTGPYNGLLIYLSREICAAMTLPRFRNWQQENAQNLVSLRSPRCLLFKIRCKMERSGTIGWIIELHEKAHAVNDPLESLIVQVNRIYHDLEASRYVQAHPEIYRAERGRWKRLLCAAAHQRGDKIRILDLASGAGFVAEIACEASIPFREFILTDLSAAMLQVARNRLSARHHAGRLEFRVCSAEQTGEADASVDIVTANSALHHFPDLDLVCAEISRILKPGGLFIAAHEPNRRFWEPDGPSHLATAWKRRLYWMNVYGNPKRYLRKALRLAGLAHSTPRAPSLEDLTAQECARQGLQLANRPIIPRDIPELVDCHVPHEQQPNNAQPQRATGIDPREFASRYFPDWTLEQVEIYGYLEDLAMKHRWLRPAEAKAARRYPGKGCHFSLVLAKPQ